VPEARWTNSHQPQTLQVAVFLLYAIVVFALLDLFRNNISPITVATNAPWGTLYIASLVGAVFAGRGIASERKWGYYLGVAVAVFPFVARVLVAKRINGMVQVDLLTLMFEVALVALLLHAQSREYGRIWFK
jgi:hypothetical protein